MLKRSLLGMVLGAVVLAATVPASAATFKIDEFKVLKGAGTFFDDTFSDGTAPPSGPSGSFCNPAGLTPCYGIGGAFSESGGRANMDTALGALMTGATGLTGRFNSAVLLSNTSNSTAPADLALGLKRGSSFTVEGTFDLATPGPVFEQYGINLHDRTLTLAGDDMLQLAVFRSPDSNVYVRFNEFDFVNSSVTLIEQTLFSAPLGAAQIRLRLNHTADGDHTADTGVVDASFEYLDSVGAVIGSTTSFTSTGQIFGQEPDSAGNTSGDELWTRGQFVAFTPVPEPATLLLLGSGLAVLIGIASRRHSK